MSLYIRQEGHTLIVNEVKSDGGIDVAKVPIPCPAAGQWLLVCALRHFGLKKITA